MAYRDPDTGRFTHPQRLLNELDAWTDTVSLTGGGLPPRTDAWTGVDGYNFGDRAGGIRIWTNDGPEEFITVEDFDQWQRLVDIIDQFDRFDYQEEEY